jgi:hypothetical protein
MKKAMKGYLLQEEWAINKNFYKIQTVENFWQVHFFSQLISHLSQWYHIVFLPSFLFSTDFN